MSSRVTANRPWSCDTFLVAADRAAGGATLLAKNSDRPAGECQPLRFHPARTGGGTLELATAQSPTLRRRTRTSARHRTGAGGTNWASTNVA